jgi:hypothetical protein
LIVRLEIDMNFREMQELFFDNSIRPDEIIHLGLQCIDEYSWPDAATEAFEDDFDQVWDAIGLSPPGDNEDEKWAIADHLLHNNKHGFLIKFATPVPISFSENGYSTNGWGYYTTKWIYADSFDEACEEAMRWHQEYIDKKRAKAA